VKYEDAQASELWEVASASRLAALGGDIESVVSLQDGYFFAGYVDKKDANGIWQTKTAQLVQIAEAVIAVPYDNGIFALRRDRAYDEIWTTNPFAKVIQVVGRVESVFHLNKTPYFLIRFNGEGGAEIWQDTSNPQKVYTFRGPIDASTTYLDGGYFFVRYQDDSPSEVWSTNPLQMAAVLNGDLNTMQIPAALAEEVVVFDYANNTISDLWSLKDNKLLSPLNGNVKKITSISGDVFFTVQYEDNQPAELWSAVEGKLVMKLGDKAQLVKSITPIKDGKYLVIAYTEGASEIWSFGDLQATLVATLPDVAAGVVPFEQGNYFAVNYAGSPAQIWQTGAVAPFVTLPTDAPTISYNTKTRRLGIVASDNRSYELNFDRILQAGDETASPTDADLLALACQQIQDNAPVSADDLAQYLGGVPPLACSTTSKAQ
jgi:WD40 repeat protein